MEIRLFDNYLNVDNEYLCNSISLVIDTFRATTVLITALYNGAKYIIPVEEIEEALLLKDINHNLVIGGERKALKIPGFDLDNSPLSYRKDIIEGKAVAITTTNGTRALKVALKSKRIFPIALINAKYTIEYLIKHVFNSHHITKLAIICAGNEKRLTLEDVLTGGYIVKILKENLNEDIVFDDFSILAEDLYDRYKNNPKDILSKARHFKNLIDAGFENDIKFCLNIDSIDCVCEYKDLKVEKVK
ncbi:2-phosphosulfolactate phosphatase [Caldicellulosiruptoraceae bacterium PP1]